MTEYEVDQACGQTPCLCGDINTWHSQCYKGKSREQVDAEYKQAYRIARRKLKQRAAVIARQVMP